MKIDPATYPVIFAVILCIYLMMRIKMDEAAQPLRLDLARRGEVLLANPTLPDVWKKLVSFSLERAFGARAHLILGIVLIPVAALIVFFGDRIHVKNEISDKATRLDLLEFCALFEEISWINNPVLKAITTIEINIVLLFASLVRIVISKGVPSGEKGAVIEVVHEWEATIGEKMPFVGA